MLILLLAIFAIVAIAYFFIYEKSIPVIEKDLLFRSQKNLNNNGMSWVKVNIDGRNVTLTGTAPSAKKRDYAQHIAQVYGVNFVANQLTIGEQLTQTIDANTDTATRATRTENNNQNNDQNNNYALTLSKDRKGKLLLEGMLSAEAHQQVVTEVRIKRGKDQFIDRITDKEVESPTQLPAIVKIMLKRIAALDDGRASLSGKKLQLSGSSPSKEAVEQLKQQTANTLGLPDGFESSFNLAPPTEVDQPESPVGENNVTSVDNIATEQTQTSQISLKKCQHKFNKILADRKIVFNSSSAKIKKSSHKILGQLAHVANQCSLHNINVHGHTDTTGRNQLNQKLSKKRAQAVVKYLTKEGIDPKHIRAIGHGSNKPIASNDTSAGRARNRRIELTVED